MMYTLQYCIPYEGIQEKQFDTLEQAREWILTHRSNYEWDISNLDLFIKQHVDVYRLMEPCDEVV